MVHFHNHHSLAEIAKSTHSVRRAGKYCRDQTKCFEAHSAELVCTLRQILIYNGSIQKFWIFTLPALKYYLLPHNVRVSWLDTDVLLQYTVLNDLGTLSQNPKIRWCVFWYYLFQKDLQILLCMLHKHVQSFQDNTWPPNQSLYCLWFISIGKEQFKN